jgi:hypothetical protein
MSSYAVPPNIIINSMDDEDMTFEQLEQKYGKLTWNEEHRDFTDADGFVRASDSTHRTKTEQVKKLVLPLVKKCEAEIARNLMRDKIRKSFIDH